MPFRLPVMVVPLSKVNLKSFTPIIPLYERVEVRSFALEYVRVQLLDVNGCMAGLTIAVKVY